MAISAADSPGEHSTTYWHPGLSVGVPEIDAQHQTLLQLLAQLQHAMAEGRARESLELVIAGVLQYADTHFRFEERLLEESHYPDLIAHRREHARLLIDARRLHLDYQKGRLRFGTPVLAFLRNWVVGHIQRDDKAYSAHLMARRAA